MLLSKKQYPEKTDPLNQEINEKIKSLIAGKKIILFSGSFDPFHKGHFGLAKHVYSLFRANIVITAFEEVIEKPNLSKIAIRNQIIDLSIRKTPYFLRWNQSDHLNCDNVMRYLTDYQIYKLFGIDSFQSFLRNPGAGSQLDQCEIIIHLRPGWEFIRLSDLLKKPYQEIDISLTDPPWMLAQTIFIERILFNQETKRYIYLLKPLETISSQSIKNYFRIQNYNEVKKLMVNPKAAKLYISSNHRLYK